MPNRAASAGTFGRSWTSHESLQTGQSKCSLDACSSRNSELFVHPQSCIRSLAILVEVHRSAKMQIHSTVGFPNQVPTTFAGLRDRSEERARKGLVDPVVGEDVIAMTITTPKARCGEFPDPMKC